LDSTGSLTRQGLLIEEQDMRYLADIDAHRALTPLARHRLWTSSDGNFSPSARAPLPKRLFTNRCTIFLVKRKEVTVKESIRKGCAKRA
jgi:hypothetical protein